MVSRKAFLFVHRFETCSLNLFPTVAKCRDPGVLFCAEGEVGRIISKNRWGLRRLWDVNSLSPDIARDSLYSHAWPSDAPILVQTLGRLFVSRRLGYEGL